MRSRAPEGQGWGGGEGGKVFRKEEGGHLLRGRATSSPWCCLKKSNSNSVQSFYNIAEIVFIYCWKRTVGLRQELSRESFDPRRGPPEKLRAGGKIVGGDRFLLIDMTWLLYLRFCVWVLLKVEDFLYFENWFLLLDMLLIWIPTGVWLRRGLLLLLDIADFAPLITLLTYWPPRVRFQKLYTRKNPCYCDL